MIILTLQGMNENMSVYVSDSAQPHIKISE